MNMQRSETAAGGQSGGCCCARDNRQPESSVIDPGATVTRLKVDGARCGGCAKSIEKALLSVDGVSAARMDLQSGQASVVGEAPAAALIEALVLAGFSAAAINR